MRLIFCKSSQPLSKLIRWAFNEPASHFAISFDDKLVMHSDLLGQEIEWQPWFMASHEIISTLIPKAPMSLQEEEAFYQDALMKSPTKPGYDFKSFAYFTFCVLRNKLFKIPIPSKNPWNDAGSYLCTEDAKFFGLVDASAPDLSITTPWQLRQYFLSTGKWVECS